MIYLFFLVWVLINTTFLLLGGYYITSLYYINLPLSRMVEYLLGVGAHSYLLMITIYLVNGFVYCILLKLLGGIFKHKKKEKP